MSKVDKYFWSIDFNRAIGLMTCSYNTNYNNNYLIGAIIVW